MRTWKDYFPIYATYNDCLWKVDDHDQEEEDEDDYYLIRIDIEYEDAKHHTSSNNVENNNNTNKKKRALEQNNNDQKYQPAQIDFGFSIVKLTAISNGLVFIDIHPTANNAIKYPVGSLLVKVS